MLYEDKQYKIKIDRLDEYNFIVKIGTTRKYYGTLKEALRGCRRYMINKIEYTSLDSYILKIEDLDNKFLKDIQKLLTKEITPAMLANKQANKQIIK